MKKIFMLWLAPLIILSGCSTNVEPDRFETYTGPGNGVEIEAEFSEIKIIPKWMDTDSLDMYQINVTGFVKNTSSQTFFPKWKVELLLFEDETLSRILDGGLDLFNFSLAPGEKTIFEVSFYGSGSSFTRFYKYDLKKYENYRAGNFKALVK